LKLESRLNKITVYVPQAKVGHVEKSNYINKIIIIIIIAIKKIREIFVRVESAEV
jgi:hypothetical protein